MRRIYDAVLLLLLLVGVAAAAAAAADSASDTIPYRCVHGELMANRSEPPPPSGGAALDPPAKRTGDGAFRSYVADLREWKSLRVATSFLDLDVVGRFCARAGPLVSDFRGGTVTCGENGILTVERRRHLVGLVVPAAVRLHTERLSVIPVEGALKVEMLTAAVLFGVCDHFTVPPHHLANGTGVDADFALYVASSPAPSLASVCSFGFKGRPVAGVMNLETPLVSATRFSVRVAAHEIAHALGFNSHSTTKLDFTGPRTRADGSAVFRSLASRSIKKVMREHYGCVRDADATMALEGGDWKSFSASGTHWSAKNARDELMAPRVDPAGGFYSALTLAFFNDLPYYEADLGKAEPMRWGKGLGCDFLKEKCHDGNGKVARPEMYCGAPSDTLQCTYSRLALGTCGVVPAAANKLLRIVANRIVTHDSSAMVPEYCAAVASTPATSCIDGDAAQMPGSVVGPDSRCLRAESVTLRGAAAAATHDICANVRCDAAARRVRVQLRGSSAWHDCSDTLKLAASPDFADGHVVCPAYDEVCSQTPSVMKLKVAVDGATAATAAAHAVLLAAAVVLALLTAHLG